MTSQPIASSRPARSAPSPARQRRIRTAAAIAALIATGGYFATTIGPDATPHTAATATDVNPSVQTQHELHQSIAGQYGTQSGAGTVVNPNAQTLRELHRSIAGQHGSRSAPDTTMNPNAQVQRELRQSIAGQYGPAR